MWPAVVAVSTPGEPTCRKKTQNLNGQMPNELLNGTFTNIWDA
jgi:hypothetical protein